MQTNRKDMRRQINNGYRLWCRLRKSGEKKIIIIKKGDDIDDSDVTKKEDDIDVSDVTKNEEKNKREKETGTIDMET